MPNKALLKGNLVDRHTSAEEESISPVILNLFLVILDLLPHRILFVRQPLVFAFHYTKLVLQHPPSLDNIRCT